MSVAHWRVGTVTVPGSTGTVAVTGLGATPKAVFFYGTNWITEDAAVTTSGVGVFRGMAAPKYDSPSTIVQASTCVLPAGNAYHQSDTACMNMVSTAGVVVDATSFAYAASFTSFDADGFTVDFIAVNSSAGSTGGMSVVYVALMDANAAAFGGLVNQSGLAFGFKAGASMMSGGWTAGAASAGSSVQALPFWGSAAYPGTLHGSWAGAGLAAHTSGSQDYIKLDNNDPTILVAASGQLFGPFLVTNNVVAYPTGTTMTFAGDATNAGMVVAWDDEDTWADVVTPAASAAGTATVSGLSFSPGLVIGYTVSDEPQGSSGTGRGAAGFFVATQDFQWCAVVDGIDYGGYQSFQRGFCDVVHNTDVHTGTIALTSDGFVMTTVDDDVSQQDILWHAFGSPTPPRRKQQIYRRVIAG